MNSKNPPVRRNISWSPLADETAEMLALDRQMKVSQLLERLVADEAKHNRIKPGKPSSLFQLISDIASKKLEELAAKAENGGRDIEAKGNRNLKNAKQGEK